MIFIRPCKPSDICHIERFNVKFRDECLNEEWFMNLADARHKIKEWQREYNSERPHSSPSGISPYEFIRKIA